MLFYHSAHKWKICANFFQSVRTSEKHSTQGCFLRSSAYLVWIGLPSSETPCFLLLKCMLFQDCCCVVKCSGSPFFHLSSKYNSVVLVQCMYQVSWSFQNLFIRQYWWTPQFCGSLDYHGLQSHSSEGPLEGGHASYLSRLLVQILFSCPIC